MGKPIDVINYDAFYQNIDKFDIDEDKAYLFDKQITDKEFIDMCHEKHGHKYQYKIDKYSDENLIEIYCPRHDHTFKMKKHVHLNGKTCAKCKRKNKSYNESEYLAIVENMYGGLYDLSELNYIKLANSVFPICEVHGKFTKRAYDFIKGCGCPKCSVELRSKKTRETKTVKQKIKRAEEREQKKSKEIE